MRSNDRIERIEYDGENLTILSVSFRTNDASGLSKNVSLVVLAGLVSTGMLQMPPASDTFAGKEVIDRYLQNGTELKRDMETGKLLASFPTAQLRRAGMAQKAGHLLARDALFDPANPEPTRKPAGRF